MGKKSSLYLRVRTAACFLTSSLLLTGRMITQHVFPLSFKEYLDFEGFELKDPDIQRNEILHYFNKYLFKGGFPEVVLEDDMDINHLRLTEYFNSILLRDIVVGRNIRESAKLIELANYSLSNVSTLLSYSKISNATGLSVNSLKEYLLYLEQAYLIYQLNFFFILSQRFNLNQNAQKGLLH